jgi:hypothetical protein
LEAKLAELEEKIKEANTKVDALTKDNMALKYVRS